MLEEVTTALENARRHGVGAACLSLAYDREWDRVHPWLLERIWDFDRDGA